MWACVWAFTATMMMVTKVSGFIFTRKSVKLTENMKERGDKAKNIVS